MITIDKGSDNKGSVGVIIGIIVVVLLIILVALTLALLTTMIWRQRQRKGMYKSTRSCNKFKLYTIGDTSKKKLSR